MHYIWKNKLFIKENYSFENQKIEIIDVGEQNFDSGPDFFNAKIKIEDTIWAGNIEIHKNSSDWYAHKHHLNKNYNNVILHIVSNFDKNIKNQKGTTIPTIKINFQKKYLENFEFLISNKESVKCKSHLPKVDDFIINFWLDKLIIERLQEKSKLVEKILNKNKNNWEETLYKMLAINFGSKTNSLPFEMLANSLPLSIIYKHKNNLLQLESLLFGQAGFFNNDICNDEYYIKIKNEYKFLKSKYNLKSIDNFLWKFNRLRPNNFPTIRIAQFASMIYNSSKLFSKIIEAKSIEEINELFNFSASNYWNNHYNFNNESKKNVEKKIGNTFTNNIIINTISLIIFAYGKIYNYQDKKDFAIEILDKTKAEDNYITKKWDNSIINIKNASNSQSIIQLYNNYCKKNNCINCEIGNKIITLH